MNIENQAVSLELSKELEKNGYEQKGIWWWCEDKNGNHRDTTWKLYDISTAKSREFNCPEVQVFVAPTVAELGEVLPFRLRLKDNDHWLRCSKAKHHWEVRYVWYHRFEGALHIEQADTEADARAKTWLYLKKEGKL